MIPNTKLVGSNRGNAWDLTSPKALWAIIGIVGIAAADHVVAQESKKAASTAASPSQTNVRRYVPTTVSDGWKQVYAALPDPTRATPLPPPNDIEDWKKVRDSVEQAVPKVEDVVAMFQVGVANKDLGGVPVLEVTPKGWVDSRKLLLYTHGGAYTMFSARSTLMSAALTARQTGMRVLSVDYTNPPRARWQAVIE